MRTRITRALVAAAAAGATTMALGFTAAGAASANATRPAQAIQFGNGTPIINTSAAGYEASGRNFRYIQALITVPDIAHFNQFFPEKYIQLSNGSLNNAGIPTGDQFTRAGVMPCKLGVHFKRSVQKFCLRHPWIGFIDAFNNSIFHPFFFRFIPLTVNPGDGVFLSIYFDQAGNELHFVIHPPTPQVCAGARGPSPTCFYKTQAFGPIYDHAAGLDDFVNNGGRPITLPPWAQQFRIDQFLQGALTTYSGARGSWLGPWTTSEVIATSNGLPFPQGHVRVSPSYLWSDNMLANGAVRPSDAFGVWARV